MLLVLAMFMLAMFGMTMFGDKNLHMERYPLYTYIRFDTFGFAFLQVFLAVSGEDWSTGMSILMKELGWECCFYYLAIVFIGQFFIFNFVLGVLLENVANLDAVGSASWMRKEMERTGNRIKLIRLKQQRALAFSVWKEHDPSMVKKVDRTSPEKDISRPKLMGKRLSVHLGSGNLFSAIEAADNQRKKDMGEDVTNVALELGEISVVAGNSPGKDSPGKAISPGKAAQAAGKQAGKFMRRASNFAGVASHALVEERQLYRRWWYKFVAPFSTLIAIIAMVIHTENQASDVGDGDKNDLPELLLHAFCLCSFIFEFVVRSQRYGFYKKVELANESASLFNTWCWFDIVVMISFFFKSLSYTFSFPYWFMALVHFTTSLRVLRIIYIMKDGVGGVIVKAMTFAIPEISLYLVFMIFMIFCYSIVGMQLFCGMWVECKDPETNKLLLEEGVSLEECAYVNGTLKNAEFNFDNIGEAMMTSFVIATMEGFMTPLLMGMATDQDTGPGFTLVTSKSPEMYLFFMLGVLVFGFFFFQLVIGIIFESFQAVRMMSHDGGCKDEDDRKEKLFLKNVDEIAPPEFIDLSNANFFSKFCGPIVRSQRFKHAIDGVLWANVVVLCLQYEGRSPTMELIDESLGAVFTAIFVVEFIMTISVIGLKRYFTNGQSLFDGFVTLASVMDSVLFFNNCRQSYLIRVFRSLRVFRLIRALLILPSLKLMLNAVYNEVFSVLAVCVQVALGCYVYGVAGWLMFGHGEFYEPYNTYLNFETLPKAMSKMFVMATGSEWTETMLELEKEEYRPEGVSVFGWKVSVVLYHLSFVICFNMVVMNLFVMVICDAFALLHSPYKDELEVQIPSYKEAWSDLDITGRGALPEEDSTGHNNDVYQLMVRVPHPIGVGHNDHHKVAQKVEFLKRNCKRDMDGK